MITSIRKVAALVALATGLSAQAQLPQVDITLVDNGNNELEVRVRPDGDFDGLFSSLVFTIRWDASSNADLGAISQVLPAAVYMPITKSGPQTDDAGNRYQIFAGFGFTPLNGLGASWSAGNEYALMTIPVLNGTSTFEIVNDAWTGDIANNGDYYVSLNGSDQTGVIYTISTGVEMGDPLWTSFDVLPNPADDQAVVQVTLDVPGDVVIDVVNGMGQVVLRRELKGVSGTLREVLDVTGLATGVYPVHLRVGDRLLTRRLSVR